ncbi:MAG: SDR family NAD(P)-dependent oxidoreductase, partial [Actinomycetales bacterium]
MSADTRTVLVTGGSSGLGAAVVDALLQRGDRPCVIDINPPKADVPFRQVDLSDTRAAEAAVEELADELGGLNGVVAAAGVDTPGKLDEVPAKEWERIVTIDLLATAAVSRAALPHLKQSSGRLVTVASTLGVKAVSDATAYCAAKFGVVGFTRALAAETAGEIGVTLLIPGGMSTAFFDGRTEQYKPGPDAKLNDPSHVAAAILFALDQP